MWLLQCADASKIFRITPRATRTLGRAPRSDFIVDAALVSRIHCRLTATETELLVDDLHSTNGTFINGRRVARAALTTGDRLRLGRLELAVSKE